MPPIPQRTTSNGSILTLLWSAGYSRPMSFMPADSQIARALYEAQRPGDPDVAPRSLEEIVAMGGKMSSWTQVFKRLKAEGRLEEQTLGQVVARWTRRNGGRTELDRVIAAAEARAASSSV